MAKGAQAFESKSTARRMRMQRYVVYACFVIVLIWIIVIVVVGKNYGEDVVAGANHVFNTFTGVAAFSALIGLVMFQRTPSLRRRMQSTLSQIPQTWKSILDSGSTKYFDPEYYEIVDGVYVKPSNPNIRVDAYGLPIVDINIPLASFNMKIYMKYYKVVLNIFNDVKRTAVESLSTLSEFSDVYRLPERIGAFYDIMKEQMRINVIGETCMIVESWHNSNLLIHRDNYHKFVQDFVNRSEWRLNVMDMLQESQDDYIKAPGLHWMLRLMFDPDNTHKIVNEKVQGQDLYEPIYMEIWALFHIAKEPMYHPLLFNVLVSFLTNENSKFGFAYMDRVYHESMILYEVINRLSDITLWIDHYLENNSGKDMYTFYDALMGPQNDEAMFKFRTIFASVRQKPTILNEIKPMIDNLIDGLKGDEMFSKFLEVMDNTKMERLPEEIKIKYLLKSVTEGARELLPLVKKHNREIAEKNGALAIIKSIRQTPRKIKSPFQFQSVFSTINRINVSTSSPNRNMFSMRLIRNGKPKGVDAQLNFIDKAGESINDAARLASKFGDTMKNAAISVGTNFVENMKVMNAINADTPDNVYLSANAAKTKIEEDIKRYKRFIAERKQIEASKTSLEESKITAERERKIYEDKLSTEQDRLRKLLAIVDRKKSIDKKRKNALLKKGLSQQDIANISNKADTEIAKIIDELTDLLDASEITPIISDNPIAIPAELNETEVREEAKTAITVADKCLEDLNNVQFVDEMGANDTLNRTNTAVSSIKSIFTFPTQPGGSPPKLASVALMASSTLVAAEVMKANAKARSDTIKESMTQFANSKSNIRDLLNVQIPEGTTLNSKIENNSKRRDLLSRIRSESDLLNKASAKLVALKSDAEMSIQARSQIGEKILNVQQMTNANVGTEGSPVAELSETEIQLSNQIGHLQTVIESANMQIEELNQRDISLTDDLKEAQRRASETSKELNAMLESKSNSFKTMIGRYVNICTNYHKLQQANEDTNATKSKLEIELKVLDQERAALAQAEVIRIEEIGTMEAELSRLRNIEKEANAFSQQMLQGNLQSLQQERQRFMDAVQIKANDMVALETAKQASEKESLDNWHIQELKNLENDLASKVAELPNAPAQRNLLTVEFHQAVATQNELYQSKLMKLAEDAETKNRELKHRIDSMANEWAEKERVLTEKFNQDLEKAKSDAIGESTNGLNARIAELQGICDQTKSSLNQQTERATQLERDIQTKTNECEELDERIGKFELSIRDMQTEIANQKKIIKELEDEAARVKNKQAEINNANEYLAAQHIKQADKNAAEAIAAAADATANARAEVATVKGQLTTVQNQLDAAQRSEAALREEIQKLSREYNDVLTKKDKTIKRLKKKLKTSEQ